MANKEFKFYGEIVSVNRGKKKAKVTIEVTSEEAMKIPTGEASMTGYPSQQELFNNKA